jgi:hypothetical protein
MTTTAAAYAANLKQFKNECAQAIGAYKNYGRAKATTDTAAIVTALATDTTKHSREMEAAPPAMRIGNDKSAYTNRILHAVNKGKAENVSNTDMHDALNLALGTVLKPVNTNPPTISGTGTVGQTLTCTTGIWSYSPTSYTYAWQRAAVPIAGATSEAYTLVAADSPNKAITCIVTATNSAGSQASPPSNTITCA